MIETQSKGSISILTSLFKDNWAFEKGSMLLADTIASRISVASSKFIRNFAWQGGNIKIKLLGVFYAHYESSVSFKDSEFYDNFAIQDGIGGIQTNGFAELYNCTLSGNKAIKSKK